MVYFPGAGGVGLAAARWFRSWKSLARASCRGAVSWSGSWPRSRQKTQNSGLVVRSSFMGGLRSFNDVDRPAEQGGDVAGVRDLPGRGLGLAAFLGGGEGVEGGGLEALPEALRVVVDQGGQEARP